MSKGFLARNLLLASAAIIAFPGAGMTQSAAQTTAPAAD